jgi:1-acyl-sn-glycerol-3-phosphate acyltransferase
MKPLNLLRVLFRAPIGLLWTITVHFGWIRVVQLFRPGKRCLKAISVWARGLSFIMGIRLHKINECSEPMGDVIVSNHMGFLDVPVIASCFPAVFIIKIEMSRVFFFGKPLIDAGMVFVDRSSVESRRQARVGLTQVLKDGDRIIVFPEGRASPGAERLPFLPGSFAAVKELDKRIQSCVIDYLPDRKMYAWDADKPMFGQLVDLFGRRRIDISIQFFRAVKVENPRQMAKDFRACIQGRLEENDRNREAASPAQ